LPQLRQKFSPARPVRRNADRVWPSGLDHS
jgi:hypothetical protein